MTQRRVDDATSSSGPVPPGRTRARGDLRRRTVLSGAATAGLSLPLLAACAGGEPSPSSLARDPAPASAPPPSPSSSPSPTPSSGPTEPEVAGVLVATADVPVGGGVVLTDDRVVVTQPTAGDFKCFSAVCTHSGCLVAGVGATIVCECHQSSFDLSTGEVLGGPAPAPLPPVDVTITKEQVVLS